MMLQWALDLNRKQWDAVLLSANTKKLAFKEGNRPFPRAEIEHWFRRKLFNLGILLGRDLGGFRVMAVDCDTPEAFETWRQQHEVGPVVRTRHGHHAYYKHFLGEQKTLINPNRDDIDYKFTGHMVAPPSVIDGFRYEWVVYQSAPRRQSTPSKTPADLLEFRREWLPVIRPFVAATFRRMDTADGRRIDSARRALQRRYSIAGQGGDLELFKAACLLCQFYRFDEATAIQLLVEWQDAGHCQPPWPLARIAYKVREATKLIRGERISP